MLSASRAITFLPLFLMGFYLSPNTIVARMKGGTPACRRIVVVAAVAVIIVAFVFFQLCGPQKLEFFLNLFYGKGSCEDALDASGLKLSMATCVLARLVSYGAVGAMGFAPFTLLPTGRLPLLTNVGARSLQVYVLHPFIYYALSSMKFTRDVFGVLPPMGAVLVLVLLGAAIAVLLSLSGAPQRVFDWMKACIARWVDRQTPDAKGV